MNEFQAENTKTEREKLDAVLRDRETQEAKAVMIVQWLMKYGQAHDQPVPDGKANIYIERLSRYPVKKLVVALEQAMDNEFRFPSIAAIRQWIEPLEDPRNPRTHYPNL
jgi:hypothetical protein